MENNKYQIGNIIIGRSLIFEYPEYGGNHYEYFKTKIINIEYPKFANKPLYVIEPKCFRSKLWEEDILTIIEDE